MNINGQIFAGVAAFIFSMIGIVLLRYNGQAPNDNSEELETEAVSKVFLTAMVAINIAVALFVRGYYGTDFADLFNIILTITILWVCAWTDRKYFLIPNKVLFTGFVIRCFLLSANALLKPQLFGYHLVSSVGASITLMIASLLCRLVSPGSIGFGDVKLLMLMGFCLQNDRVWVAVLFTMILSFFYSLFLIVFRKADRKTEMPFAPLLLMGTIVASIITTV